MPSIPTRSGWVPVPDYGGRYECAPNGAVYDHDTGHEATFSISPFGQTIVTLEGDPWPVTRLVWSVHGAPIKWGLVLAHIEKP